MSYVSQKRRANPVTLSAAVAFNGAIIIAVALSPMVVDKIEPRPVTRTFDVTRDPPPPPPNEKITETPIAPAINTVKPIIDTPLRDDFTPLPKEDVPVFTTDAGGGDEGAEGFREPVKPPLPVFKASVRDPRFARNFQPDYPPGLLLKELEGTATVKVLIGADGRVRQVIVLRATHPDFGKATEKQALREWRFKPATRDGVAVEDWQTLTVRFDIT